MPDPEFMVHIRIDLPPDMDPNQRETLERQETQYGRELLATGALTHIWRLPGQRANIGIWRVPDATALHTHLEKLPLRPWMTIDVTALAHHPLTA